MAQNEWRSAIEIHPPDWKCPAEPFWIAGWIMASNGSVPVDVRACLGEQIFLGLCGMPRPEIEKEVSGRAGPPYTGFCFLLTPHRDATELRLEACDSSGRWQEFYRHIISIAASASVAKKLITDRHTALLRLLAAHKTHPARPWKQLAIDVLASEHATPLNSLPNPPFYGALEQPDTTAFVRYGRIAITGWLAHRERRIVRLTAFIDSSTPVTLLHGLPRPDVTGIFADLRDATVSRFAGYCAAPGGLPLPACLRIFAELDDGKTELVFAQRFRPKNTTGADAGLPKLSRYTFWRARLALDSALKRHGNPEESTTQIEANNRLAWADYTAEAAVVSVSKKPLLDPTSNAPRPLQVTLVTHNLNREGAPLIALEYACHLAAQPGWRVRIVSPEEGPLRESFEAAGLSVSVVDIRPLFSARSLRDFDAAVAHLATDSLWQKCDLVIANTMVAFWAIHVARKLRKPSLFYIHESASVRNFFVPFNMPALVPCIEEAFALATRTVFSASAACGIHTRLERQANFLVVPGWIDVKRILAYAASHSPMDLRRTHGLPTDAVIFSNIGSVTERKGQHVFVEAVDFLLRARATRGEGTPPLVFLMVGSSPGFYLDLLRHDIERRNLPGVKIIEHVADAHAYFRLSDIFVCSSFEEALPRVVMEAAAFRLPIVSTDVNGIPEIFDSRDAWLVPAGDPVRMAAAMESALAAHLAKDTTRAERSHRAVLNRFDSEKLLKHHTALAAATADLPVN